MSFSSGDPCVRVDVVTHVQGNLWALVPLMDRPDEKECGVWIGEKFVPKRAVVSAGNNSLAAVRFWNQSDTATFVFDTAFQRSRTVHVCPDFVVTVLPKRSHLFLLDRRDFDVGRFVAFVRVRESSGRMSSLSLPFELEAAE